MARTLVQRFGTVIEEIERTLDQPLSIDHLASIAAFSRFHFQRQFSAFAGVSLSEYHRLARLKRAAHQLAFRPEQSVTGIAFEAGYETSEAFTRAFKRVFGHSPSGFRSAPCWTTWHETFDPLIAFRRTCMPVTFDHDEVRIVDFPQTRIAALEHRGDPAGLPASLRRFIAWRKSEVLPPSRSATFNILYDDPGTTAREDFRFDICCKVPDSYVVEAAEVQLKTIPAGRCAVLRHRGSMDFADNKIRSFYGTWLPASGEELRDFPLFLQRLTFYPDVPEHEAETDIYLPLK